MLETPLYGKLANEDRLVVFSAPTEYHVLVRTCVVGGGLAAAYGFLGFFGVTDPPVGTLWFFLTALAVCLAGVFAAYSLAMMRVDMKSGQYRRRDGAGAFGRTRGGPVANLDALVMIAEQDPLRPAAVTYHLILHWKPGLDAPMVVQHDTRAHLPGSPLNVGSSALRDRGLRYAQALKIPFYDNAHFLSPNPVRFIR